MKSIQRNPLTALFGLLVMLAVADLLLLISGYRILVGEDRGIEYAEGVYKYSPAIELGETLTCSYFTGRSVQSFTLGPYGAKLDECPFVYKPRY